VIEARVVHEVLFDGGLLRICGKRGDYEAEDVADLLLRILHGGLEREAFYTKMRRVTSLK